MEPENDGFFFKFGSSPFFLESDFQVKHFTTSGLFFAVWVNHALASQMQWPDMGFG